MRTFESTQPWVVYEYGRTHDRFWPPWSSTRVLGFSRIGLVCAVCGASEVARIKIPRFGAVPQPASGRHPVRERFLLEHAHPERGHSMSWALPLLNPFGSGGVLDLDLLAMRLEADLNGTDDGG